MRSRSRCCQSAWHASVHTARREIVGSTELVIFLADQPRYFVIMPKTSWLQRDPGKLAHPRDSCIATRGSAEPDQPPMCALVIPYASTIGAKYFVRAVKQRIHSHYSEVRREDIAACERRWLLGNVWQPPLHLYHVQLVHVHRSLPALYVTVIVVYQLREY
jgi:hypothetical protein